MTAMRLDGKTHPVYEAIEPTHMAYKRPISQSKLDMLLQTYNRRSDKVRAFVIAFGKLFDSAACSEDQIAAATPTPTPPPGRAQTTYLLHRHEQHRPQQT